MPFVQDVLRWSRFGVCVSVLFNVVFMVVAIWLVFHFGADVSDGIMKAHAASGDTMEEKLDFTVKAMQGLLAVFVAVMALMGAQSVMLVVVGVIVYHAYQEVRATRAEKRD